MPPHHCAGQRVGRCRLASRSVPSGPSAASDDSPLGVAREPNRRGRAYWPRYSALTHGTPNQRGRPPSPPPRTVSCTTYSSGDAPCQCTMPAGREDRTPAGHHLDDLPRRAPACGPGPPRQPAGGHLPAGMGVPVRADPGLEAQPKRSHVGRVRPARLAADEVALRSRGRRWLAEREDHEHARSIREVQRLMASRPRSRRVRA